LLVSGPAPSFLAPSPFGRAPPPNSLRMVGVVAACGCGCPPVEVCQLRGALTSKPCCWLPLAAMRRRV
jgi:hypothetical protein